MELLGQNEVDHRQRKLVILSQDRFYKVLTAEQKAKALKGQYNFDHPGRGSESWEGVGEKGRPLRLGPELAVDGEVAPGGPWLNLCGADWGLSPGSLLCALGLAGAPGSIGWSRSGSLQLRRVFRPTALPQLWSWRNLNAFMLSGACYADCFHWGRVLERPAVGEEFCLGGGGCLSALEGSSWKRAACSHTTPAACTRLAGMSPECLLSSPSADRGEPRGARHANGSCRPVGFSVPLELWRGLPRPR